MHLLLAFPVMPRVANNIVVRCDSFCQVYNITVNNLKKKHSRKIKDASMCYSRKRVGPIKLVL